MVEDVDRAAVEVAEREGLSVVVVVCCRGVEVERKRDEFFFFNASSMFFFSFLHFSVGAFRALSSFFSDSSASESSSSRP